MYRSNLSLLLIASTGTALAHHGVDAHFDTSTDIRFEAVVTDIRVINPHSYIYFSRLNDAGELVEGRCELFERRFLVRHGLTGEALPPGTPVRITGNPARREAYVCHAEQIELADGRSFDNRGQVSDDSDYVPGEALMATVTGSAEASSRVIAESSREAVEREPAKIPTEGMFGNWLAFTGMLPDGLPPGVDASELQSSMMPMGGQMMGMGSQMAGMGGETGMGGQMNADAAQMPMPRFMGTRYQVDYTEAGQAFADTYDPAFDSPDISCQASVLHGMQHHALVNEFVPVGDDRLRWVYGYMDMVRTIHMDQSELPDDLEPSVLGHSIGYWDGPTLVVHTRGFRSFELFRGVINSDALQVVERVAHDPETDRLIVSFTALDPKYWRAPLQGEIKLARTDQPFTPYGCIELAGENNLRPDGRTIFD
ncbi:MAG: DUF6152 family protein [Rhodospirillaceae bacterium]|nr:DUF6152 family protein [Rhodospirillaceae bacterium]